MTYIDWHKGKVDDTLEVEILCSKCKQIHTVVIDRISKLTMSICPNCSNVDVERTAGKIPLNVEKQLDELVTKKLVKTIDGIEANEFLNSLVVDELDCDEFDLPKANNLKSYSGLYRLKSYYGQFKAKKQMNLDDFPTFESFMLWAVKNGYRDWKTLKLDVNAKVSKQSQWIPGGYIKKNADKSLQLIIEMMTVVADAKNKLSAVTNEITAQTDATIDMSIINKIAINLIQQMNIAEAEAMNKL